MQRRFFRNAVSERLMSGLEADMPDVWKAIEGRVRSTAQANGTAQKSKRAFRRWVPAAAASVAGLAVAVTCAAAVVVHSPAFRTDMKTAAAPSSGVSGAGGVFGGSGAGSRFASGFLQSPLAGAAQRTASGSEQNRIATGIGMRIAGSPVQTAGGGNAALQSGSPAQSRGNGQTGSGGGQSGGSPSVPRPQSADLNTLSDDGGSLGNLPETEPDAGFVNSYNGFGLNLVRKLYNPDKNVLLSPASLWLGLGMARNGGAGRTADEFDTMFGNTGGLNGFNQNCLALQSLMGGGSFRLANSIWIDNGFLSNVRDDFLARDRQFFGASVFGINLYAEETPGVMDNWVMKNTGNLINPGYQKFDQEIKMVLINTIYFKAAWETKFPKDMTRNGTFSTPNGDVSVPFMTDKTVRTGFFTDRNLCGYLLPYADQKTSMLMMMPTGNSTLSQLLNDLTPDKIAWYVRTYQNTQSEANLVMPRLDLKYDSKNDMNQALQSQGLKSAFGSEADFTGLTKTDCGLCIGSVEHQTCLQADEDGTTAAAVTTVTGATACMPVTFDHPFFVAIVNNDTGAMLFAGTVIDPSGN